MSVRFQENVASAQALTSADAAIQLIDYLTTFDLTELIAKVEALRRPGARAIELSVGPLELDLIERSAKRGDRSIDLLPREFYLLEYMIRHRDQILTRAKLLKEVWNYKFVPENNNLVDVHMGRLRRKIDGPDEPPMIHNVRGAGFVLRAPAGRFSSIRT